MYYTSKEISTAINKSTEIINYRAKEEGYVRGFSDCYALLVEYDRVLRGKTKADDILNFEYLNTKEFLYKMLKRGYNFESFAKACNYEILTKPRPMFGDIGFKNGSAMIAGEYRWVTVEEDKKGVRSGTQYSYFERNLQILARPLRSSL